MGQTSCLPVRAAYCRLKDGARMPRQPSGWKPDLHFQTRYQVPTLKKTLIRRCLNRVINLLARVAPGSTTLRPLLHRARGVKIGQNVFIGDDVYIDAEYPESIEIHDGVQISIRALIIAHTRGPGKVIIGKNAFIGPHVIIASSAGRVLKIGEGAVISAGCVITKNVPPHMVLTAAPAQAAGYATIPLPIAKTMQDFWSGLRPLDAKNRPPKRDEATPVNLQD